MTPQFSRKRLEKMESEIWKFSEYFHDNYREEWYQSYKSVGEILRLIAISRDRIKAANQQPVFDEEFAFHQLEHKEP